MISDYIEKTAELTAPVARVWRALTDHNEFGAWFRAKLDGPFAPGKTVRGHITYPGYEHLKWEVVVRQIEPERLFSFTWHPYAVNPKIDYSMESPTLVEFRLSPKAGGTLLTVKESGFDKIPLVRVVEAYQMHDSGWAEQMQNIAVHLAQGRKE